MRIACVDQSAAHRVGLQKILDEAFAECRKALGQLNFSQTYPASAEEVIVNSPPQLIVVGPGFSLEESYAVCRELKKAHPAVPVFVFFAADNYSLRNLQRMEKFGCEVFCLGEPATRLVHRISRSLNEVSVQKRGRLIAINGVKGGVGVTSLVSGLAHAAEALGKKAVVVDLSLGNVFACYVASPRIQSPDYAAALVDGLVPDEALVKRCISTSANGISVLLSPAGGSEIRELWLRDPVRFELSLSILQILQGLFDLVIVDIAGAEGILQFAINCQVETRLLVTSNDPASVHLLNNKLSSLAEAPGDGQIRILLNKINDPGLSFEDMLDFLCYNQHYQPSMPLSEIIPFDSGGRNWIGTGNSFYTESSSAVQRSLEQVIVHLFSGEDEVSVRGESFTGFWNRLRHLTKRVNLRQKIDAPQPALPLPSPVANSDVHCALGAVDEELIYEPPKLHGT